MQPVCASASLEDEAVINKFFLYLTQRNAAQFARRNPFRTLYAEMCANYFGYLEESYMDSTLEKLVRLQMVSDKISETFPAYKDPDRNKAFTYLINDEMRPIRSELDRIAESIDQDHPQFRKDISPLLPYIAVSAFFASLFKTR